MSELTVGEGTQVTLHFSLSLEDGAVVDSNFDSEPATFSVGDGKLLKGFEDAIVGMGAGESGSFVIQPENGFGQPNPNNIHEVERSAFDDQMELAEGLVVSFADAAGGELPGVVKEILDDVVIVDFNHPLAGRSLTFKVEIISVTPAVTH